MISLVPSESWGGFKWVRASARNLGAGLCPAQSVWQGSGFAADQTNAMLAVVRADDESLVPPQAAGLALSVARPLPTETASLGFGGNPVGGGDKSSRKRKSLRLLGTAGFVERFAIYSRETRCFFCWLSRDFFSLHTALFRHSCVGGGITTLRLLWLCRNNPARGLFRQKNGFLRVGALHRRTRCSLLHTVLFRHFCVGGGITTLGVRFMPLKRWTPVGHGGVFAVFMPSWNLPCAG